MTDSNLPTKPAVSWADVIARLDAAVPDTHPVAVPEWGLTVQVRGLTRNEALRAVRASTNARSGAQDQAAIDKIQFLTGVVAPRITADEYEVLKNRPDANPILQRIHAKIAELTTGEKPAGAADDGSDEPGDGEGADAVSTAERFLRRAS